MHRRQFLLSGAALLAVAATGIRFLPRDAVAEEVAFPVEFGEEEWRARLSADAFAVLREDSTERPYSSPLNEEKRAGTFSCAGCGNELYSSGAKYDSRTGWPSFFEPIEAARVGTKTDYLIGYPRTEVHCARCGGHLGHIFDDGPPPTGKRHCINGVALAFQAGGTAG